MKVFSIDHKYFCASLTIALLVFNLNIPVYANAKEDAYLDALESEASELKDFEPPSDSEEATTGSSNANDGMSEREREFADKLKETLPNTFLIFDKLSKTQKGLVIEAYFVNDRNMAEASRQIFNIYFKKIK